MMGNDVTWKTLKEMINDEITDQKKKKHKKCLSGIEAITSLLTKECVGLVVSFPLPLPLLLFSRTAPLIQTPCPKTVLFSLQLLAS